jgi:hypothetical protein
MNTVSAVRVVWCGPSGGLAVRVRHPASRHAGGAPAAVGTARPRRRDGRQQHTGGNILMAAAWKQQQPISPDTEGRMAQFTELVATAIANAHSSAQLSASALSGARRLVLPKQAFIVRR